MKTAKKAKRAPAKRKRGKTTAGSPTRSLIAVIEAQTAEIERLIEEMRQQEEVDISDLLTLQFMANMLSQITEMSSSVLAAMNDAISSALRNAK